MQKVAAPLLVAALRRLATCSHDPKLYPQPGRWEKPIKTDPQRMDTGRPTLNRLRSAVHWESMHPQHPYAFLHCLRHAGYVLVACDLIPSRVHAMQVVLRLTRKASDGDLLACAHLSAIGCFPFDIPSEIHRRPSRFPVGDMRELIDDHGWTLDDLVDWSTQFDFEHYKSAVAVGWGPVELRDLLRAGEVPDASQVEMMAAFARSPEDASGAA